MAKVKYQYKNIDSFHITFYCSEDDLDDCELVVLRNKKIINTFYGKEAVKIYNLLVYK